MYKDNHAIANKLHYYNLNGRIPHVKILRVLFTHERKMNKHKYAQQMILVMFNAFYE